MVGSDGATVLIKLVGTGNNPDANRNHVSSGH